MSLLRDLLRHIENEDWHGTCSCNVETRKSTHTEETRETWCPCYADHMKMIRRIERAIRKDTK